MMNKVIRRWEDDYSAVLYRFYITWTPYGKPGIYGFILNINLDEWCKENNITYKAIMCMNYNNPDIAYPTIIFNTKEDAMAFKLQWS